jgi:hypothetical protein
MHLRKIIPVLALAAALSATTVACSSTAPERPASETTDAAAGQTSEGGPEFCEVLLSDTSTAATVFVVMIPDMNGDVDLAGRAELVDRIESVPDGLEDDLETWRGYLDAVAANVDDAAAAFAAHTDEVEAAGSALFDAYTDSRL